MLHWNPGAGLAQEEEEEEVMVATMLHPSLGLAFLLVPQGMDGTKWLGWSGLCW